MRARIVTLALLSFLVACGARDEGPSSSEGASTEGAGSEDGTSSTPAADPHMVLSDDACESDADCGPAECCHAAACVAAARGPACGDALCTTDCRYGTIDCGGACLCFEGRCAARLSEPPRIAAPE